MYIGSLRHNCKACRGGKRRLRGLAKRSVPNDTQYTWQPDDQRGNIVGVYFTMGNPLGPQAELFR